MMVNIPAPWSMWDMEISNGWPIPIDIPTAFHRHCAFSCSSRSAALGVDALGFFWQRKLGATNIPSELAGWIWMVDFMENLNINMENNMVNTLLVSWFMMIIIWLMMVNNNLVGGGHTYPSEKWWSESQLGLFFPIYGKIKNGPNHQSVKDWIS